MAERIRVEVSGAVQGVGFRPFVYGLASRLRLGGFVLNEPRGVTIELEGSRSAVDAFLEQLKANPPPLARIESIQTQEIPPLDEAAFAIRTSAQTGERAVLIAPDEGTCDDCLRELHDPQDRRYRYPFINCTNCGPRYTIICGVPYDRAKTTMADFAMCPACRAEYEDPSNRRFHAEPTCCPVCGPQVELVDPDGHRIVCEDSIAEAVRRLDAGEILAVKGLGGFHLACDAANDDAVHRLRQRKHRDLKPFALLARDVAATERFCLLSPEEREALLRRERPILLLRKRPGHGIADAVAPRSASFGVMLPYTPLHDLLMEGPYPALVMTSGNLSDEPIAFTNEDAIARLGDLADCLLLHNRAIHIRTDDSVARVIAGRQRFLRRSRGYAPFPVRLARDTVGCEILATGPELSATMCLTRGGYAFLSHHIGDLENLAAYESFLQAIGHLKEILGVAPVAVACDLHPDYASTRYARECGLPMIAVQHHHAHIASVLAEAGRTDTVIGVSFDGIGWGDDATAWGGEFLVCDLAGYTRAGHLEYVPQPGGDAAAKRPMRMAYVYLREAFGDEADRLAAELLPGLPQDERQVVSQLIDRRLNCPLTSSMGRLFDAASALLRICDVNTYHAQAPMELEAEAHQAETEQGHYDLHIVQDASGTFVVRARDVVRAMVEDFRAGASASVCAARFHNSIAHATLDVCRRIRNNSGISTVVLSGGVFANAFLVERLNPLLGQDGFEVLMNALVPAGDGGVSLGQAAVAAWRRTCV